MKILMFSKNRGQRNFDLGTTGMRVLFGACVFMIVGALFAGGFLHGMNNVPEDELFNALHDALDVQSREIRTARFRAEDGIDALAVRLGEMQARMLRLDAVGRRLTQMAGIDDSEFDFESPPAQGGREPPEDAQSLTAPELVVMLAQLERRIDERRVELDILESVLMARNLREQSLPGERPVKSGYISSLFGLRTDPILGQETMHRGVDFAAREGTDIVAVAAGVVAFAGQRPGFGNLLEIDHGASYVTRYAHNEHHLVAIGEKVEKGQVIGFIGSTGRVTGPNLHFEVLHDGRVIDPLTLIDAP
ncbi:MAG: M23 family metallopeptidase [Gammaproteobacteria bacterium]